VLNGVVMVALFNDLREGGMAPEKAVVSGADHAAAHRADDRAARLARPAADALSTGIGAETQKPSPWW